MLTQPLMYKRIKAHPNVLEIYSEKLLKEGIIVESFINEVFYPFFLFLFVIINSLLE